MDSSLKTIKKHKVRERQVYILWILILLKKKSTPYSFQSPVICLFNIDLYILSKLFDYNIDKDSPAKRKFPSCLYQSIHLVPIEVGKES